MGKHTSFNFGEQIAIGRDGSARIDALRQALIEGENSGPSKPFDFDAFIKAKRCGSSCRP